MTRRFNTVQGIVIGAGAGVLTWAALASAAFALVTL